MQTSQVAIGFRRVIDTTGSKGSTASPTKEYPCAMAGGNFVYIIDL